MRLQIVHLTRYRYSEAVSENYNEVRLQPVSDVTQECHEYRLNIRPAAVTRRYHDLHLNLVDHFYLADPHDMLEIEARSEVSTFGQGDALGTARFPRARLEECRRMERCYDFLQRSEYVSLEVDVWRMAQDLVAGCDDTWMAAQRLMAGVHAGFAYDPGSTTVATGMVDVLRSRRGVCQDFAHVLIGLCRSLQIPARYVSGYVAAGGDAVLRGDLASHAWAEVFLPGHGWLGLDPTNNRPADEHHVKVAVGRDYADAAPICGNFRGRARQELSVELQIRRVDG